MEILYNCFQVVTLLRNDNRKKLEKKVNEWIDNRFPIVDDCEKSEVFRKLAKYSNAEFKRFAPYDPMVLMRLGLQMMQSQCENWLHVLKHPQIENYPSDQVSLLHQSWMINPHQEYSWAHYCEQSWIIADQQEDSKHFDVLYLTNLDKLWKLLNIYFEYVPQEQS